MLGENVVKRKKVRIKEDECDRWFRTDTRTAEGNITKRLVSDSHLAS
jgi:hypothetical protein